MAAGLDITKEEAAIHFFEGSQLVAGAAGLRVDRSHSQHAANLEVRVDFMSFDDCFGGSEELMMGNLIENRVFIFARLIEDARVGKGCEWDVDIALVIDFVKGHPELDFVLIALEAGDGKAYEHVDKFAAAPAAIGSHQMVWQLEM